LHGFSQFRRLHQRRSAADGTTRLSQPARVLAFGDQLFGSGEMVELGRSQMGRSRVDVPVRRGVMRPSRPFECFAARAVACSAAAVVTGNP